MAVDGADGLEYLENSLMGIGRSKSETATFREAAIVDGR